MTSAQDAIVVVDDETDILEVVSKILERSGFVVHGFNDPRKALEHVESGCDGCWLLLSDVRMPSMSGFELVRKVKELRPEMIAVLMTAFEINGDEFSRVLPSTKVDAFIPKPAKMSVLAETVRNFASLRQKVC